MGVDPLPDLEDISLPELDDLDGLDSLEESEKLDGTDNKSPNKKPEGEEEEEEIIDDEDDGASGDESQDEEPEAGDEDGEDEDKDASSEEGESDAIARAQEETRVLQERVTAQDRLLADAGQQVNASKRQTLESEKKAAEVLDGVFTDNIETIKADVLKAAEAEDMPAQITAQDRLGELRDAHRDVKTLLSTINTNIASFEAGPAAQSPDQQAAAAAPVVRPITQRWMGNNPWFQSDKYKDATATALAIDGVLLREGKSPDSPEYYTELTKRMKKQFPAITIRNVDGTSPPRRRKRGTGKPGGPASPGSAGTRRKTVAPVLNKAGVAQMETYNMDPKDPAAVREFLLSKRETLRKEQEKG